MSSSEPQASKKRSLPSFLSNALLSTITGPLLVLNPDGKILYANDPGRTVFGPEADENEIKITGRAFVDVLQESPFTTPVDTRDDLVSCFETENTNKLKDFRLNPLDDRSLPVLRIVPYESNDSSYYSVVSESDDWHEMPDNKTRDQTIEPFRKARINQLLDELPVALIGVDSHCEIQTVNAHFLDYMNTSESDFIGRDVTTLFEFDRESSDCLLESVENGRPYSAEALTLNLNDKQLMVDLQGDEIPVVSENSFYVFSITGSTAYERKTDELRASERRLSLALNAARAGIWDWNLKTDEEYWDENTEQLFGLEPGEFDETYQAFEDYVVEEDVQPLNEATSSAIENRDEFEQEFRIETEDGERHWLLSRGKVVTDEAGNPDTMIGVTMDITDKKETEQALKRTLDEKETLLAEIHHRVKNNLQIINSLLSMQSRNLESDSIRKIFQDSQNRVRTLALIHETLYQSSDADKINIREYLENLIHHLLKTFDAREVITTELSIEEYNLELDRGIATGLIVNELVTNSLEHGFNLDDGGTITLDFRKTEDNAFELTFSDNGHGLDEDFSLEESSSTGLDIVKSLAVYEHDGSVTIEDDNGVYVSVTL